MYNSDVKLYLWGRNDFDVDCGYFIDRILKRLRIEIRDKEGREKNRY